MSTDKKEENRPKGRRGLIKAQQEKSKLDANLLFNREKNRKRAYNLPFYLKKFHQMIVKRGDLFMSKLERRRFEVIILDNGLEVLLVNDTSPKAAYAACAMSVNVGYFSDPPEMEGLAHLTEHMMFLGGNDSFKPGELAEFVTSVNGLHNAYTVAEETNYHFSVPYSKKTFEAALDRFTSSFVNPRFTGEGINQETKVVHSEYAKNIGDPMRSTLELLRGNSNSAHPFSKFSCGNYHTLHEVPLENKFDIPEYLTNFFKTHYSSHRMKAVLIAPISTDLLKDMAKKFFSRIEKFESVPLPVTGSPYTEKENFTRFDMITNEDKNTLLLSFPLEGFSNFHKEMPHIYICESLGSRHPGSLIGYLEDKGWGNDVVAFPMQCANHCTLFWVQITCTEEGIWDHVDDIIHAFFNYISKLYHTGLDSEFIDNLIEKTTKNHAQYIDTYSFRYCQTLASNMLTAPKGHVLTHGRVPYRFNHEVFLRICEAIRPEFLTVVVSHKGAEAVADMQEKYYKSHYTMFKMDPKLKQRFNEMDSEMNFKVPKTYKEKDIKQRYPFKFERPKTAANATKLKNLPRSLKNNQILKQRTQFFKYVNFPKDTEMDTGKIKKNDEDKKPPPPKSDKDEAVGGMKVFHNHANSDFVDSVEIRVVKDCAEGEEEVGTIDKTKKKKEKGFLSRGVINKGATKPTNKPDAKKEKKIRGVRDELETTNEIKAEKFAFASDVVGKLYELNSAEFYKPPLPDMFRPPLLIKANEKSLLFLKQNIPVSLESMTTQVCVNIYVYPKFLSDYKATPRTKALFSFYMFFVNTALSSYKRKKKYEDNIKCSIGSTTDAIAISLSGYDLKVLNVCRELFDEMKRINSFKWHKFESYKKILLGGTKDVTREPRNVCSTHMNFFTIEPKWMYEDIDKAIKAVKLRDCKQFCKSVFEGCNMQVLVVGNATPTQATNMFDLLEISLKSSDHNKLIYNPFPETKRVVIGQKIESFYVTHTEEIFKNSLYEFRTYNEDANSAYHCMLQMTDMTAKRQATLSLLGNLIDSPCNEEIRTKQQVGYLIHSAARTGSITGSLEFMFQSDKYGPFQMDLILEKFLVDYFEELKSYTKGRLIKAKKGIAAPILKPATHISRESDYWAGFVVGCSYDFDSDHKFVDELWKVTLDDILEMYKSFVLPKSEERRKLVVGVTCGRHKEADEISMKTKLSQENVNFIEDPYEFKYSNEVITRR